MRRIVILIVAMFLSLTAATAQNPFYRGAGDFVYTDYEPLKDKPVTVYFYIPTKGDIATMRVLFSMHGAERSGKIARDNWQDLAEADGFIVIAPEFSSQYYKENDYQFGGVFTDKTFTELRPREQWTYSIIEPLFDYFVYHTNSLAEKYDMQGHSAGHIVFCWLLLRRESMLPWRLIRARGLFRLQRARLPTLDFHIRLRTLLLQMRSI